METGERQMEVVVRGRNVEVPEHFRQHVTDKLARVERYDHKVHRADVELNHEKNRRQNGSCQHIEITCRTRGPVVRAEACAADFYQALDIAVGKLERRFRQAADRRRVHHGRRTPVSVAAATSGAEAQAVAIDDDPFEEMVEGGVFDEGPGRVVREKTHSSERMTVDQALFEMELVGHDFFLFADVDQGGTASVVYRRHAYDYGLIRLTP
jgi:ribosomal subunit interface protein